MNFNCYSIKLLSHLSQNDWFRYSIKNKKWVKIEPNNFFLYFLSIFKEKQNKTIGIKKTPKKHQING